LRQRVAPVGLVAARRLRDSQMVDRLVRGRAWIGLLGVLLIGLVGLNVSLLKLNAAAGRNAEWARKLRIENADLQARVSKLRSGQRIQDSARAMGFVMPAAASVHYLTSDPGRDAPRAAARDKFTAPWSNSDLVSGESDTTSIASSLATGTTAPAPPATGSTGPPSATGTTGTPSATGTPPAVTPSTGTTPSDSGATGATGTESLSQQPSTGATVP
jgi:cell division protein FtsB